MHHQPLGKLTGLVWSFGLNNPSIQVQPIQMIRFGGPKFPREQGEAFGDVEEEGLEVYIERERGDELEDNGRDSTGNFWQIQRAILVRAKIYFVERMP